MSAPRPTDPLCKSDYHCPKHKHGVPWLEAQCYSCWIERHQAEIGRLCSDNEERLRRNRLIQQHNERLRDGITRALEFLAHDYPRSAEDALKAALEDGTW